ncbi:MAG: acyl-CoA dehydrogenase family protein [Chloroflexi bacterium]|nr:acyl-CoA dehydrogenase family protein [Chloroflexota bacterium]
MDFELTDEQRALRTTVREFAESEVAPHAAAWDRDGTFPLDAVRKLGALGVMGLPFPEQYGGVGAGSLAMALAIEELARVDSSVAITVAASTSLAGWPLLQFGTEEQKQRWLVPLARGEALGAFASTEPGAGSDVQGIQTSARDEGDAWVIDGTKAYITNAGTPISLLTIVMCATGTRPDGRREITNIVVPSGTLGFMPQAPYRKMGWHASDTRELTFNECRVPLANTLGERGAGARQFLATLDGGRVGVGALSVGLAQGCLDHSVAWARQRTAFGRPIATYQAIAFQLADLQVQVDAARALVHGAARLRDAGKPHTREAAAAKLFASELAVQAANTAMQVHGGYGYMEDSPIPRFYRDAKILTIGEGTSEILRLVIARRMGLEV